MLSCSFENLSGIYSHCKTLTIPLYQREYSWDHSHISELLCDIITAFKKSPDHDYFLGTIVLVGEGNASQDMEIVDGQQRLTSIFLILQALSMQNDDGRPELKRVAWGKGQSFLKLKTMKPKQQVYYDHYFHPSLSKDLPQVVKCSDPILNNLDKKLFDNLSIILYLLKDFKIWDAVGNTFLTVQGNDFSSIFDFIEKQCKFVTVICQEKSSALRIFGTLNSKGMPLNDLDLIKYAAVKNLHEREMRPFFQTWDEIFAKNDSDEEAYQLLSIFFNYHFDYQQRLPKHDWLKSICQIFIQDYFKDKDKMNGKLDHLLNLKNQYITLKQSSESIVGSTRGSSRSRFKITQTLLLLNLLPQPYQDQWITLVLRFMDQFEGNKLVVLQDFLNAILRYFTFIFLLSQTRQTNAEKVLSYNYHNKIGRLMKDLSNPFDKDRNSFIFTEEEKKSFASNLSRPIYGKTAKSKQLCKLLLLVLEFNEIQLDNGVQYISKNLSVEHVEAQTQSNLRDWSETDRQLHLHRLGNCTILSKSDNSSHGANEYNKKKKGYETNVFQLTRQISQEHSKWTVQDFKNRHYKLLEKLGCFFEISNEMKKVIEAEKEGEASMSGTINASALILGEKNSQISICKEQFQESFPILKNTHIDQARNPSEKSDIQDSGHSKNRWSSLKTVLEGVLDRHLKSKDTHKALSEILTENGAKSGDGTLVIVSDDVVDKILKNVASTCGVSFHYRSFSGYLSTIASSADSADRDHICIAQTFHGFIEFELGNLTYSTNQEEFLNANGFKKNDIARDGNCQFAAIADQLKTLGFEDIDHKSIRTRAVEFLKKANEVHIVAGKTLRDFIDAATGSCSNYIQKMRCLKVWGDDITLQVLAQIFQVKINVISPTVVPPIWTISPWSQESEQIIHDVFILFHDNHYDSLVLLEGQPGGSNPQASKKNVGLQGKNNNKKRQSTVQNSPSQKNKRLKNEDSDSTCNQMVDSSNHVNVYSDEPIHEQSEHNSIQNRTVKTNGDKILEHQQTAWHEHPGENNKLNQNTEEISHKAINIGKIALYTEENLSKLQLYRLKRLCKPRGITYDDKSEKDTLVKKILMWQDSNGQIQPDIPKTQPNMQDDAHQHTDKVSSNVKDLENQVQDQPNVSNGSRSSAPPASTNLMEEIWTFTMDLLNEDCLTMDEFNALQSADKGQLRSVYASAMKAHLEKDKRYRFLRGVKAFKLI